MYHYCSKFTRLNSRGLENGNWIQHCTNKDVIDVEMNKCFQFEIDSVCILTKNGKHANFILMWRTLIVKLLFYIRPQWSLEGEVECLKEGRARRPIISITPDSDLTTRIKMSSQTFLQTLVELFKTRPKSSVPPIRKTSTVKGNKRYIVHDMRTIETSVGDCYSGTPAPYSITWSQRYQLHSAISVFDLIGNFKSLD